LSAKAARESVEAAERKCALQTKALARSEARAAAAESRLQAAVEEAEAAREEDKEAIRRAVAIRESLEAEVSLINIINLASASHHVACIYRSRSHLPATLNVRLCLYVHLSFHLHPRSTGLKQTRWAWSN
jgi:hypothetical protein